MSDVSPRLSRATYALIGEIKKKILRHGTSVFSKKVQDYLIVKTLTNESVIGACLKECLSKFPKDEPADQMVEVVRKGGQGPR